MYLIVIRKLLFMQLPHQTPSVISCIFPKFEPLFFMGPQADGAETGAEPEMSGESLSDQWPLGAIMVHTSVQDLNCWDLQGLSLQLPLVQMHVGSLIYQQRSHVENIDLSWQKDGIRWKIYSAKSLLSPLPDLWFFPTFLSTSLEWSGMSFKKKASLPSPSCSGVGLWWYIYVWPSKFAESLFWETCGWITSQESKILLFQLPGPFGDPKLTTLDDNGWRWNNHFFFVKLSLRDAHDVSDLRSYEFERRGLHETRFGSDGKLI